MLFRSFPSLPLRFGHAADHVSLSSCRLTLVRVFFARSFIAAPARVRVRTRVRILLCSPAVRSRAHCTYTDRTPPSRCLRLGSLHTLLLFRPGLVFASCVLRPAFIWLRSNSCLPGARASSLLFTHSHAHTDSFHFPRLIGAADDLILLFFSDGYLLLGVVLYLLLFLEPRFVPVLQGLFPLARTIPFLTIAFFFFPFSFRLLYS